MDDRNQEAEALTCLKRSAFSEENRRFYRRNGYVLAHDALVPEVADRIIGDLEHNSYLKVESDGGRGGVTIFYSKNGEKLFETSPIIATLEREMVEFVNFLSGKDYVPLDNRSIGASVNITPPGGGFQTHFDRQDVSAIAYLNTVEGGALDVWPRLRRWEPQWLGNTAKRISLAMTRLFRPVSLMPRRGSLLIFTKLSPHRVAEVTDDKYRISVVFGLDFPGTTFLDGSDYYGDAEESVPIGALR